MFRNYLAATLRNLARNRLYAGINIIGLAVGFAAAILIALFVRDEFSYDKFIPGHERTFAVPILAGGPWATVSAWNTATSDVASLLKLDFPSIEAIARLRIAAN